MEIKGVGGSAARIEDAERTDDARRPCGRRESKRGEIDLLFRSADARHHVRQHLAERSKAFSAGGAAGDATEHEAQVVAETTIDGIADAELQRSRCRLAAWSPAKER